VGERRRILIVEDDLIDRELLKASLQNHHGNSFEFAEEAGGAGVLGRCCEFRPDCILLDLNLPDMNGLDVLSRLSQSNFAPPVVVITAFGNEQIAVKAMKSGAIDYVVKNALTPENLGHTVENAIEKHQLRGQVERQARALEQRNKELEAATVLAQENQERYRTLTEAIPQVVWTATHPDGLFDHVSARWCEATGLRVEAALGTAWQDAIHPEDRQRVVSAWHDALRNRLRFEAEFRLGASEHGYRWHLARAAPRSGKDTINHWFGTFTDVEDRRRAEQALLQRQKLESTGLLAGGIAHDFNNLLVGILGGISYALECMPGSDEARPSLQTALLAAERAAMLVRQMLAYAGKGKFIIEPVNLQELVRSTCNLVRATIPKLIHLDVQTSQDTPILEADSSQIQQIVMNLIINAAESIGEDKPGIVTVRTAGQVLETDDSLDGIAPGLYAVLEVIDTGSGMTEEVQSRIFEPFYTTKFTGRGLGLAAVMGIVSAAKGAIRVQSVLGEGTTFRVLLPAKASTTLATPVVPKAQTAVGTVLVVDDEDLVRRTVTLALQRSGYEVHVAASGEDALALVRASPHRFNIVLLDMNMPGLSGEETLRRLHFVNPELRVVVFTGYSEREVAARVGVQSVAGILQKPFTARTLVDRIAEFLNGRPNHA
jgi:PAS domain S-box-containing protein